MGQNAPTVVGIFDQRDAAERAVATLQEQGFRLDQIGMVIRGSDAVHGGMITDAEGTKDRAGALTGMAAGGVVGGVLGALAALVIPGVGPVLATGILTSALGGAVAGVATGGILGAMRGLEISEEEAVYYEQQFNAGKALVAVRAPGRAAEAGEILRKHGGFDITNRRDAPIETVGPLTQP